MKIGHLPFAWLSLSSRQEVAETLLARQCTLSHTHAVYQDFQGNPGVEMMDSPRWDRPG